MLNKKRKIENQHQEFCIPKCCQQPRSRGTKPRTDFSHLVSSSSSSSCSIILRRHRGEALELSRYEDGLSMITTASLDQGCQAVISRHKKEMPRFSKIQYIAPQYDEHEENFSNFIHVPFPENESILFQNTLMDQSDSRKGLQCESESDGHVTSTLDKSTSQAIESRDACLSPGSIVWAKKAYQTWWPAKIVEEKSSLIVSGDQVSDRHVLVQYYGSRECAWVDPDGDISQFHNCFEERSCNPLAAFQDALKQALHQKEQYSSCTQLDMKPDELMDSSQHEHPYCDKLIIESSTSRTQDSVERGRGKRKRKPKLHFDELIFPMRSIKKMRRFRIMRYLGLSAPTGSPFLFTSQSK